MADGAFLSVVRSQFAAALDMLGECFDQCPDGHWDDAVAKYPFWMVAYHTLCFVDLYLTPGGEKAYTPRPDLHPKGWVEFDEEYPSRRFEREELVGYLDICRERLAAAVASETAGSLEGPSGFERLRFSRAELYLYNLRHLQHHTGQLSAVARRAGGEPRWRGMGRQ